MFATSLYEVMTTTYSVCKIVYDFYLCNETKAVNQQTIISSCYKHLFLYFFVIKLFYITS